MSRAPERPDGRRGGCHGCRHYYVTYEEARPHGCRAYGFVSANVPADVVRSESGADCQLREERSASGGGRRPGRGSQGLYG